MNGEISKGPGTNASEESNYFPVYVEQKITKPQIPSGFQSLVFYDGPKGFADFQKKALQITKELVLYYQKPSSAKTPFITLSPWTCFINKRSGQEEVMLIQEQLSQVEQTNQDIHIKVRKHNLCRYLAPELLIDAFEPTIKSDIFSLGCLLLFIFDNSIRNIGWLFKEIHTELDYIQYVKEELPALEPKYRDFNNQECWNYLKKMASFNPEDRPPLEEIIKSNKIFPANDFNLELKIPEFQFKYYYKPWNGNQFDDHYNVGQPLLDTEYKTQYFLGRYKYSQTDVTIFENLKAHQQYQCLNCFLPKIEKTQNNEIIISRTCVNYVNEQEYKYHENLKTKETMEIDIRFNKIQLQTQRQATQLVFQLIFLRCILEEQRLFLTPNTKFTFQYNHLLIAGTQFITFEEQESDFILEYLENLSSTNQVNVQRIKYVIESLLYNTLSNYQALIIVGQELDEIVLNRDYFRNILKRCDVPDHIKKELEVILNYYHPKFMRRDLEILLRNFIKDYKNDCDTRYLEKLQEKYKN